MIIFLLLLIFLREPQSNKKFIFHDLRLQIHDKKVIIEDKKYIANVYNLKTFEDIDRT